MPAGHVFVLAAVAGAFAVVSAGCGGGSEGPSVASLEPTTGAATTSPGVTTTPQAPSPVAWATCMNAHGIAASVGPGGHGFMITGNVDPGSPQFQTAQRACAKYQPGGGPPQLTPAQQAQRAQALAVLAACMRKHGVSNFPDPNGQGELPLGSLQQLNPDSPLFKSAYKSCWSLFPKVGPQIRLGP